MMCFWVPEQGAGTREGAAMQMPNSSPAAAAVLTSNILGAGAGLRLVSGQEPCGH